MISGERFPKEEHILKTRDFREIYSNGRSVRREFIVMYCRPNDLARRRIGFSISSRSVKLASRRNRIKRCFREVYRKSKDKLADGIDMVLIVKRDPGAKYSYQDFLKVFEQLARAQGIMK